jgi:hypothetical protein
MTPDQLCRSESFSEPLTCRTGEVVLVGTGSQITACYAELGVDETRLAQATSLVRPIALSWTEYHEARSALLLEQWRARDAA